MAKPYALKSISFTIGGTAMECWLEGYTLSATTPTLEWDSLCPSGTGSVNGVTRYELEVKGLHDWSAGQTSLGWYLLNHDGERAQFSLTDNGVKADGTLTVVPPSIGGDVNALSKFNLKFPVVGKPTITSDAASAPRDKFAVLPGDVFPADAAVTAYGQLTGAGYIPASTNTWSTGQKFTVGSVIANWSGSAWASGAHA